MHGIVGAHGRLPPGLSAEGRLAQRWCALMYGTVWAIGRDRTVAVDDVVRAHGRAPTRADSRLPSRSGGPPIRMDGHDEPAVSHGNVGATGRAPTRMDGHDKPTVSHGIVRAHGHDEPAVSRGNVRARRRRAPTPVEQFGKPVSGSIPTIIRAYKSAVTTRINQLRGTSGAPVWQRNYHERIIRDMDELSRIREYIRNNPAAWETDDET